MCEIIDFGLIHGEPHVFYVPYPNAVRHGVANRVPQRHAVFELLCISFAIAVAHGEQQLLRKFVVFGFFHADSDVYSLAVAIHHRRWSGQRYQYFFRKRLRNDFAIAEFFFYSLAILYQ